MKKEVILDNAYDEFASLGIKRVSMDDIAGHLKISKKTLYDEFLNKENLVLETLRYRHGKVIDRLKNLDANQQNILRGLIISGLEYSKYVNGHSAAFCNDIKASPALMQMYREAVELMDLKCRNRLRKAVEQGFLDSQRNYDIFLMLYLKVIMDPELPRTDRYTPAQVCFTSLVILFTGVATAKGREEIAAVEKELKII